MRKMKIMEWVAVTGLCGLLAVGCETRAVIADPAGAEVEVSGPPPAPLDDAVVGVAPGPDYVWIGGSWGWVGNRWTWHGGHWDRPPRVGVHWTPDHYEVRNGHHVYRRGGWR